MLDGASEWLCCCCFFFFQAEDGIRDLVRSRGLGDVYKRQDRLLDEDHHQPGPGRDTPVRPTERRRAEGVLQHRLSLIHI